jgi:hypothetical protein
MIDILDIARSSQEEPKLTVRKASHAPVWSVWAVLEGVPPEEIFEGLLRRRRQAGSIPAVKLGLKNAGENAMPSADARTKAIQVKADHAGINSSALAGTDQFRFPRWSPDKIKFKHHRR